MRKDPSRKPDTEELINKYFSGDPEYSGQNDVRQPGIFAKKKVFRNILTAIGRRKPLVWRLPAKWQVAASVMMLFCLSLLGYRYRNYVLNFLYPERTLTSQTAVGEIRKLTLDDGTEIWLNAASRLTYPARFSKNRREISLEGEAYFDVAHEENRPFIVHTDRVTTRVLGTRFNISAYREEDNITVSVVQGKVGVSAGGDAIRDQAEPGNTMLVLPKQHVVYHKSSRLLSRGSDEDPGSPASWKEGMLAYRDATLAEIVADLQRAHNVRIETGKKVKGCKISADFNNDSLTKVLRILAELVNGELSGGQGKYLLTGDGCGQQP